MTVPWPSGLATMMHCEICQQIGRMLSASTPQDMSLSMQQNQLCITVNYIAFNKEIQVLMAIFPDKLAN